MRKLEGRPFDQWRARSPAVVAHYGGVGDETCGVFEVINPVGTHIHVVASQGGGWDHVSASLPARCPTWEEMVFIKRAFFKRDEWVMELHPPEHENISRAEFCLHLWRPQLVLIPLPPPAFVG